jgi:hypothetical protein
MTTFIGFVLLLGVIVGGLYLYQKVERLDREIAAQREKTASDVDDGR